MNIIIQDPAPYEEETIIICADAERKVWEVFLCMK